MASHPEQFRIQIEEAISSAIPYDNPIVDETNLELLDVIPGKGSSHFIAIFYANEDIEDFLEIEVRPEIMDAVASTISRKRIPNITLKLTTTYPEQLPPLS